MSSNTPVSVGPLSNEADLFALFQAVWQQKKIVIATTLLGALLAISYALLATPEYQVSSTLRPAAINVGSPLLKRRQELLF